MNKIDTDQTDLFIAETADDTVRAIMENAFEEKFAGGYRVPRFCKPQTKEWLESAALVDLNEEMFHEVLNREQVATAGEEKSVLAENWNGFIKDAIRISVTRTFAERLLKDQDISGLAIQVILRRLSNTWSNQFALCDLVETPELRPMLRMLEHDKAWASWMRAPGGGSSEAEAAKVVMAMRSALRDDLAQGWTHFLDLVPSARTVANAIAQSLADTLDRALVSLNEISKIRAIDWTTDITPKGVVLVQPALVEVRPESENLAEDIARQASRRRAPAGP